jgi:hypothetical protein
VIDNTIPHQQQLSSKSLSYLMNAYQSTVDIINNNKQTFQISITLFQSNQITIERRWQCTDIPKHCPQQLKMIHQHQPHRSLIPILITCSATQLKKSYLLPPTEPTSYISKRTQLDTIVDPTNTQHISYQTIIFFEICNTLKNPYYDVIAAIKQTSKFLSFLFNFIINTSLQHFLS